MIGSAKEPADDLGPADPPVGPPSADALLKQRARLAGKLTAKAVTLRAEARRLQRVTPQNNEHPVDLWTRGLTAVREHLIDVGTLHEDCELLVKQMSDKKHAADADENQENGEDADQMELDALSGELGHLDTAIAHAASVTRKAVAAVAARTTDSKREDAYFAAAGELAEIAGQVEALVGYLKGEAGLPGGGSAPRLLSTILTESCTYRTRFRIMVAWRTPRDHLRRPASSRCRPIVRPGSSSACSGYACTPGRWTVSWSG